MAHSTIVFKQPNFGTIRNAPVGFSWTTLCFGCFPAIFRGDFKWAAINILVTFGVALVTLGFGAFIPWIIFAVIYNKMYIRELAGKGYVVERVESRFNLDQLQAQLETVLKPAQAA
ncbi:hypothetical protein [Burkholderia cepacia]|uniref:hypothetical protein n=1 Tax=Burkholderia cepacia TaxID=292 RepID=UPI00398E409C